MAPVVKNPPANAGDIRDAGSIPGSGRSPGGGYGNPPQYSCLGNPMDRGAWWATVRGGHRESDTTEATQHSHRHEVIPLSPTAQGSGDPTPPLEGTGRGVTSQQACSVLQSCPTLCDPMDCSPPGFSVHGILQARKLKWIAMSFSRGSS